MRASADDDAELLWALRGGGGNFGIVTSFTYRLHQVGPTVLGGPIFYSGDAARDLFDLYRTWTRELPAELNSFLVLTTAPPVPFLPESVHGQPVAIAMVCCCRGHHRRPASGRAAAREFGPPIADLLGPMPYNVLQTLLDGLWGPGASNYFRGGHLTCICPRTRWTPCCPSPAGCPGLRWPSSICTTCGGAVDDMAADATAYAGRGALFLFNITTRWDNGPCLAWRRPHRLGPLPRRRARAAHRLYAYVNFLGDTGVPTGCAPRTRLYHL